MSRSAALQVKIGADIRDLRKGLDAAAKLANGAGEAMEKSFAAGTGRSETAQRALNKEIGASNRLIGQMVSLLDAQDKQAVKTARNAIREQKQWLDSIGATASQYVALAKAQQQLDATVQKTAEFNRSIRAGAAGLDEMGKRAGPAFNAVLYGAGQLANGTDGAVRAALRSVSTFAFAFGPAGMIVSAIGAGLSFVFDYFAKTREESAKTREQFVSDVQAMVRAGDNVGLVKKLRDIYVGDPAAGASAVKAGVFKGSLGDLEAARAGVSRQLENAPQMGLSVTDILELRNRLKELDKAIAPLRKQFEDLSKVIQNPVELPRDITGLRPFEIHARDPFSTTKHDDRTDLQKAFDAISGRATTGALEARSRFNDQIRSSFADRATAGLALSPEHIATLKTTDVTNLKLVSAMDKAAAAEARRAGREEVLINSLSSLSANIVSLGANFIAQKFGAAGSIGGQLGGGIVSGLLQKGVGGTVGKLLSGKVLGSVLGSALPGIGTIAGGLVGGLAGKVFGGLFGRHKKKVDKSADALDKLGDAAKKVNDQLLNIPTGFKVTFARWLAADANNSPGGGGPSGGGPGAGGTGGSGGTPYDPGGDPTDRPYTNNRMVPGEVSPVINIETLIVHTNDPDAVGKAVAKSAIRAANRGGVSSLTYAVSVI